MKVLTDCVSHLKTPKLSLSFLFVFLFCFLGEGVSIMVSY